MTVPQLSDLPQFSGKNIDIPGWSALLQAIVNFQGSGDYDAIYDTLTATNFVGLPDFDITGIAGESITQGNVVRMLAADGKIYKATNTTFTGISNYIGIAKSTVITGDSLTVSTRTYSDLTGLTTGALYYIGASGAITTTTPTSYYQLAGIATSATSIIILPSFVSRILTDTNASVMTGAITEKSVAITSADSPYTASSQTVIYADATSGAITINLPASSGISGRIYRVIKTDSSINAVTVDGNSSETIGGTTTRLLRGINGTLSIVCDGANWQFIHYDSGFSTWTPSLSSNATWSSTSVGFARFQQINKKGHLEFNALGTTNSTSELRISGHPVNPTNNAFGSGCLIFNGLTTAWVSGTIYWDSGNGRFNVQKWDQGNFNNSSNVGCSFSIDFEVS